MKPAKVVLVVHVQKSDQVLHDLKGTHIACTLCTRTVIMHRCYMYITRYV